MAAPSTPTNVYVQSGNGQVLVSWDISAGATSYPVLRSTDNVTFSTVATVSSGTQYLDTSVTVGTQYWYTVEASNGSGTSTASESQSAIPTFTGLESLAAIRLQAQQRADRVNSNFVTLPEWNNYINQSYFELYDLLKNCYEEWYFAVPYQFQTSGSLQQYNLPDGTSTYLDSAGNTARPFYNLLGVDCGLSLSSNAWVSLGKFDFIERNRYVYPNITSTFLGVFNMRYRLVGNSLFFIPTPSAGQYIRVWYIPRMVRLLKDTDQADGVSGWSEYIIVDAAIKALQKEESDVTALMLQKQALVKRIEESAMNRDAGQPDTISPTRSWGSRNGGGWGPGFDGGSGGF